MSRARDFADLAGSADAGGITGKNMVVNGSFAVSQRGTSFSAPNGTYTLDRMRCAQANSADTISQQTFTAGQTDVPGSPKNYLRFAFGAATANRVLETRIEDVYTLSGQSITLSFYAKASAAHTSTIEMTQNFGSGGSSDAAFGTQSYDITTSWQRFDFTLSCPSISGKTVGAGNYLSAAFIRSLSAGPSINVDIALLQLEVGEQATPFDHSESYGETLAKCQRYYHRVTASTAGNAGDGGFATGAMWTSSECFMPYRFPVQMRSNPTLGLGAGIGNVAVFAGGANQNPTSASNQASTTSYMEIKLSGLSNTQGRGAWVRQEGSYIDFDAEL
jgi:hypothetical protein